MLLYITNVDSVRLRLDWKELLDRCDNVGDLLEIMGSSTPFASLRDIDPTYSALFEFTGFSDTSFRLEARFKKTPGCAEVEVSNSQWFRARSKSDGTPDRMALQIGVWTSCVLIGRSIMISSNLSTKMTPVSPRR